MFPEPVKFNFLYTMKSSWLILFLLGCTFSLFSQNTQEKGYIVNMKGDTVRGEIRHNPKKEYDNYEKINFKDEKGLQKNYNPEKIKAFGFADQHYVSFGEGEEAFFYRRLTTGAINMYKFMFQGVRMNQISYESEYYLSKNHKDLEPLKMRRLKKQLTSWMPENDEFIKDYTEPKEFDPADIAERINKYNTWKAGQKPKK